MAALLAALFPGARVAFKKHWLLFITIEVIGAIDSFVLQPYFW